MACFIVPAGEAIITTIAAKVIESREKAALAEMPEGAETAHKPLLSPKLKWLNNMLWGGSALLMFEHVWHGEVVPWFPFFTRAQDPSELQEMLHEIATVGVGMAILVTAVWAVMVLIADLLTKRPEEREKESAV